MDRYLIDNIIDIERATNNPKTNRFIYVILNKLIPKPECEIFISLTPESILNRGCDENIEEIREKYNLYEKLVKKNKDLIIMDNEKDVTEVSSEIIKTVITKFFDKYPDKYDGYKVKSWRYK